MESRLWTRAERAALLALGVTLVLGAAKIGVWAATGSLAILSQALDSILDVVALVLVFLGVRIAAKPADRTHHYGHGKAENLAAFAQTLILLAVVTGVALEAVRRLAGEAPDVASPWYAFALLASSAVVDVFRVRMLTAAAAQVDSDALRAGALNFATDIGTAVVALASLGLVRAGIERADAVGGLIVALAVAVAAFRLGRRSVDVLMDRAPEAPVRAIAEAAARAPGVSETRRVRVRTSGNRVFADVTVGALRTASLQRAHDIAESVEDEIAKVAPGADVVVHVEPAAETEGLVERAQAAASRVPGTHEIHNVSVHAFNERGRRALHVTLHAKVAPGTSLEDAHGLSDRIEAAVESELGPAVRVDSHIEPLAPTELGRDVTPEHEEIAASIERIATQEPDVLDCHEVLLTSDAHGLSVVAHVRGKGDLPLARIHDASERIEKAIQQAHPEIAGVLIHFEPA